TSITETCDTGIAPDGLKNRPDACCVFGAKVLLLEMHEIRDKDFVTTLRKAFGNSNEVETVLARWVHSVNYEDGRRGLWSAVDVDRDSGVTDSLSINGAFPRIERGGVVEDLGGEKQNEEKSPEHKKSDDSNNSNEELSAIRIKKSLSLWDMSGANASPIGH